MVLASFSEEMKLTMIQVNDHSTQYVCGKNDNLYLCKLTTKRDTRYCMLTTESQTTASSYHQVHSAVTKNLRPLQKM